MIGRGVAFVAALLSREAYAEAVPKQPTGKWVVNFDDAQCVASRNYGSKDQPLFFVIKAPPLGDVMQISFVRSGSRIDADQVDATITVDDSAPLRVSMVKFAPKGANTRVHQVNLPVESFSSIRQATRITVRSGGLQETLSLSGMEPLMRTMQTCVADLRQVWNVTEADKPHPLVKQHAVANLKGIFKPSDYPGVALRDDAMGTVSLGLLIDERGNVADCTVVGTSEAASLDAQSCVIVRGRAKFTPALGLDGKPTKSSYLQRITWRTELRLPEATRIKR